MRRFLIVDDNPDGRFVVSKTLLRTFPDAIVQECQNSDTALAIVREEPLDAVLSHRTAEVEGLVLIRLLRDVNPTIPIIMFSGIDRTADAAAAGATRFLDYSEWLNTGKIVAEILGVTPALSTLRP